MADFAQYLAGLTASWEALAAPRPGAVIVRGDGFVAARFADSVLNNAVVLDPAAIAPAEAVYDQGSWYALWSRDDVTAAALDQRGYRPSETTCPMICALADVESAGGPDVLSDADPERIAALNGVAPHLVRGVPGLRGYATAGYESGLVLITAGADANVSFVATRPEDRGRGLATGVVRAALLDARRRGALTASLQATPLAERLYARLGFRAVGRWQEWSPPF